MSTFALLFAGGVGQRMGLGDRPKQFLEIGGKPIVGHTIERFARHPEIDAVTVVCLNGWIDYLETWLRGRHLFKKVHVIPGGASGQESIYLGLKAIEELDEAERESVVLVHDGVRPLIDDETISACIESVEAYGATVTVAPAIETIIELGDDGKVGRIADRSTCAMARAPQGFRLGELVDAHEKARSEGMEFIDSLSMMMHYGHEAYVVEGPAENIKVTTPADYFTCKAIMDMRDVSGLWGNA